MRQYVKMKKKNGDKEQKEHGYKWETKIPDIFIKWHHAIREKIGSQ